MSASKLVFLALYGIAVFFSKRLGPLNGILVTLFLFEFVYSAVASQYLVWTVPFLLLTQKRVMFWCYEIAATYALVVFYWIFFPDILFGAQDLPRVDAVPLLPHYVISQALFSAVCAAGIVVFGTGTAATPHRAPRMEEAVPARRGPRLGVLGQLVCSYYLVLFVWEIAFVGALK
jgi:hypothetical protein